MIKVEVVTTEEKLARGLMYRDHLPEDSGMLFIFDRQQPLSFWGRNTWIGLDIAFIDKEGKVVDTGRIRKLSEVPVRSKKPALMALEVNEGYFAKHGINVGDSLILDRKDGHSVASFSKGEGTQKTAQVKQAAPKQHPMLPFDQEFNQPMPDWLQDAQDFRNEQAGPKIRPQEPTGHGFTGTDQPDEADLPEMDISDIMTADDEDNQDEPWMGGEPEDPAAMSPEEYDQQQADKAQEQAPPPPPPQDIPDPRRMNTMDALKYAQDKGLVMWINYRCKNAKKKIGMKPPRVIHRIIQPHGVYHAKTTGNILEVTWDMSVNDFRAYIIPQITAKGFTGQTFKKFFRVAGDDSIKQTPPPQDDMANENPPTM